MIPRRLSRVAIISSIGGLRPTCLGLPAGGVVDKGLWLLRKNYFFSYRLLVVVAAGDGMLKGRLLVAARDGMLKDRLLVAVAAGDGMLKDGKDKRLAADAKAWHLRRGRLCGVLPRFAGESRVGCARQERSAFDATEWL